MKKISIHQSDKQLFKRCRRKWDLSSPLRQRLEPKRVVDKLFVGIGVHKALEELYKHGKNPVEAFSSWADKEIAKVRKEIGQLFVEQEEMLGQAIELGKGMLANYEIWCRKADPEFFVKVLSVERELSVPILTPRGHKARGTFGCRIDQIVEDCDELLWLMEHKTAASLEVAHLPLDEQVVCYLWAAQQFLGIKLQGVIYNILLKKLPSKPQLLKNGTLSKKKISTTYGVYKKEIEHHKLEPEAYSEILQELKDQDSPFFRREKIIKTQEEIAEIGRRIYDEYRDMRNPKIAIYPNPTRDCFWDCPFREVCIEMNSGGDVAYLLQELFQKREA